MNIDDALYQIGVHPAIPTYHDHGLSSDTPMFRHPIVPTPQLCSTHFIVQTNSI